jgi:hypothetical protein
MTAALCRNGPLVNLREMPREVQEIVFDDGLIPMHPDGSKRAILNARVAEEPYDDRGSIP